MYKTLEHAEILVGTIGRAKVANIAFWGSKVVEIEIGVRWSEIMKISKIFQTSNERRNGSRYQKSTY